LIGRDANRPARRTNTLPLISSVYVTSTRPTLSRATLAKPIEMPLGESDLAAVQVAPASGLDR
jgi:hypothetical protein